MNHEISVIGAGSWGTALALLLADQGHPVTLWGYEREVMETMAATRRTSTYLPGLDLPENLHPTHDLDLAARARLFVLVSPSKFFRAVAADLAARKPDPAAPLVSCTKGIEQKTGARMTSILEELLPGHPVAALSGPSHAEEVCRKRPAAVTVGTPDAALAATLQTLFNRPWFRVYTTDDIAGIELGGALKNVFAIAAGVSDGLGLGDNAKAALVTRALAEMSRLGAALGGRRETFQGLSGIGDLIVTCFSRHSRNRLFGERLGRGEPRDAIAASMHMVAEGVPTAVSALECAIRTGTRAPIIEQTHAMLYEGRPAAEAVEALLRREPRPELE